MKTKKLFYVVILLLFLSPVLLAEDHKKISVDEALKYYCQTWINPAYYENPNMTGLKICFIRMAHLKHIVMKL